LGALKLQGLKASLPGGQSMPELNPNTWGRLLNRQIGTTRVLS
jgi:hypothetical protein